MRRKLRSVLTVFGIAIGVFALVVMGGMAEKMNMTMTGAIQYIESSISVFPDGAAGGFVGRAVFPASAAAGLKDVEGVRVVTQGITLLFEEEMPMVTFGMRDMINGININEQIEVAKYNPDLRLNVYRGDWWEEGNTGVAVLGINRSVDTQTAFEGIRYRSFLAPLLFQRRAPVFPVGILLSSRDAEKRE
ncbi:ABC transporter permease [Dehalococcoidia bacterium]|nr:ABC transporter permease [Dehalococcoidia bacterium]